MRILLIQSSLYVPSYGGANKSNRYLLEALGAKGHECRVIASAYDARTCGTREELYGHLRSRGIIVLRSTTNYHEFEYNHVGVMAARNLRQLALLIETTVSTFTPDWLLVSSEDPGQSLLKMALRAAPHRTVYLGRTTLMLPFGPDAVLQNPASRDLIRQTAGVVVVSRYLREYMRKWGGIDAVHLPLSLNGGGPFPYLGHWENKYVTMINPCAYKGIGVFESLARMFQDCSFAAVPTWGTTETDKRSLRSLTNVTLLEPCDDINALLRDCRIVMVPSLWAEAKARVITEAMLRGIPVLASDVGGNSEALLGVDYLLPVEPITDYKCEVDSSYLPIGNVPKQDIAPWCEALSQLLLDRGRYESLSKLARSVALEANAFSTIDSFEAYLQQLRPR